MALVGIETGVGCKPRAGNLLVAQARPMPNSDTEKTPRGLTADLAVRYQKAYSPAPASTGAGLKISRILILRLVAFPPRRGAGHGEESPARHLAPAGSRLAPSCGAP